MKVIYNVGNEKYELENISTTIDQDSKVIIDQDKSSLVNFKSPGWKDGDIIVRKDVSRIEPNYFIFRDFGTSVEHDRVNVEMYIRFTKDQFFLGGSADINPLDYETADLQKQNDILMSLRDYGYCWNKERSIIEKRAKYGHNFYSMSNNGSIITYVEEYDEISDEKWESGNYFLTEKACKIISEKISYIFDRNKESLAIDWKNEISNS